MILRPLTLLALTAGLAGICPAQSPTFNPHALPGHSPGDQYGWRPCCGVGPLLPHLQVRETPGYTARVGLPYRVEPSRDVWPACTDETGWKAYWAFSIDLLPYPIAYPWPQCSSREPLASMSTAPLLFTWGQGWISRTVPHQSYGARVLPGGSLAVQVWLPNDPSLIGRTMWVQLMVDRWGPILSRTSVLYGELWWDGRTVSDVASVEISR